MNQKKEDWKDKLIEPLGHFLLSFNIMGWCYFLKVFLIDSEWTNVQWGDYQSFRERGYDIELLRSIAFIIAPYILWKFWLPFYKQKMENDKI